MTDAAVLRRRIDAGFAACERAWRVRLCCHTFGAALIDAGGTTVVPGRWHAHRHPGCLAAKRGDRGAACMAYDLRRLPADMGGRDAPAWLTCPAGIEELIQPVRCAGRLEALLYLGPASRLAAARRRDLEAMTAILAGWLAGIAAELAAGRDAGDSRLTRIGSFIDAHLADDPDLGDLAAHLGLSPERARHLVRELTGLSFRAFRDARRLEAAQRRLRIGFRPVNEIALACGCADPGWFGRWFRRQTGLTPLAWRRREQAQA